MRLLIITQDDPFYLGRNLDYLIERFPSGCELTGCVVFEVSPFGKRESFIDKIKRTYRVFGLSFVINYGFRFLWNKLSAGTKVKKVLEKHGVPLIQLEKGINTKSSLEIIRAQKPDVLVSIAGNQIFKKNLLAIPAKGTINLHTALLPKYRGLMPTFWVLKNNEPETGVSVFFVDEGIDSGPIIVQERVPIENQTQRELILQTKKIGMDCILKAIEKIRDDKVELIPNPEEEMTYFSFPTREDVSDFRKAGKRFY